MSKGIISGVCMSNIKSLSLTVQKLVKVKVDNRQTDKQIDRQIGQKQYARDCSIREHKDKTCININLICKHLDMTFKSVQEQVSDPLWYSQNLFWHWSNFYVVSVW